MKSIKLQAVGLRNTLVILFVLLQVFSHSHSAPQRGAQTSQYEKISKAFQSFRYSTPQDESHLQLLHHERNTMIPILNSNFDRAHWEFAKQRGTPNDEVCPNHPIPQPLPSPLPYTIMRAFNVVEEVFQEIANNSVQPPIGLIGAVLYRDEIVHWFSQGVKNKSAEQQEAPDLDTIFQVGSISKLFPAIETFQLRDRGIYRSLDDPLSTYAPKFSIKSQYNHANPPSAPITLRSMLCQMSGMPRQTPCEICGVLCPEVDSLSCNVSSDWIYEAVRDQYVVYPPYTRPSYSNLAFALLGRVPEAMLNLSFAEYVQKEITEPLGMTNTGFIMTPEVYSKMAQGYGPPPDFDPITYDDLITWHNDNWEAPAGLAYSTARDLITLITQFSNAQIQIDSAILSADTMKEMLMTAFLDWDGTTIISYPWESFYMYNYIVNCKAGNINGFSGAVCIVPDLRLGFVTLMNINVDSLTRPVAAMEVLLPAFTSVLEEMRPPIRYPSELDLTAFTGLWASVTAKKPFLSAFSIYLKNDTLYYGPKPVAPLFEAYNQTMVYLTTEEDGSIWFQCVYPDGSPSRLGGGSCQSVELGAYQYKTMVFDKDLKYMMFPSVGGQYYRLDTPPSSEFNS